MVMTVIIKADKEDLKDVSLDLIKSSNTIDNEISVWEDSVNRLKSIWMGKDADIFYSRIESYIIKLKMLTATSNSIGSFINKVNNSYIEKDQEFADDLKKENDKYEPDTEPDSYN